MLHIGYLDEAVPAELLDARVEELARIIARNKLDEAAADCRRREKVHDDQVRQGSADLTRSEARGLEARDHLSPSRQCLPRAGKLELMRPHLRCYLCAFCSCVRLCICIKVQNDAA